MEKIILGKKGQEIIDRITINENVLVGGIPGIGTHTLLRNLTEILRNNGYIVITLFPNEINSIENKDVSKIILSKTDTKEKKLSVVIVIHKIDQVDRNEEWFKHIDSIRKGTFNKVVLLASCHLPYFKQNNIILGFNRILFDGFIYEFDELINSMCTYFEIENVGSAIKDRIFKYALGHTGLIKNILLNYKINKMLPHVDQLIKQDNDSKRRLAEIFQQLDTDRFDTSEYIPYLTQLGLYFEGKHALLPYEYYKTYIAKEKKLVEELTLTEKQILDLLKSNGNKYINVDYIMEQIYTKDTDDITNWTLYKHINNLNKKLLFYGLRIKNKRGLGYKLDIN